MNFKKTLFIDLLTTLGLCSLGLVLFLYLENGSCLAVVDKSISQTPQRHFGLLFFSLPLGALWKKFSALFPPTEPTRSKPSDVKMAAFMQKLAAAQNLEQAIHVLLKGIKEIFEPKFVDLYLFDTQKGGFHRKPINQQRGALPEFFPSESRIPEKLAKSTQAVFLKNEGPDFTFFNPSEMDKDQERKDLQLLAPISIQNNLSGWLVLSPGKNKRALNHPEIVQVEILTQLFSAIYEKMELRQKVALQRVQVQIRNRITDSIKSGRDLNQILTEVYHQLRKHHQIQALSLVLREPFQSDYQRVYLIQDEVPEIIPSQPTTLKTNFVEKTAIATGQITTSEENGAWLVLPLVLEDKIIGALSLRKPENGKVVPEMDSSFTKYLANAITTVIQTYHLDKENKRQKQQLAVFNRISQQLTSIINLDSLLANILESAMNILHCDSGILMVFDEDQDELEVKVTAGPVGAILAGERLPHNAGIAGKVFTTRKPILSNRIDPSEFWFTNRRPKAVEKIENILATPLIAHGQVIGVLEAINKHKDLPFNENDQGILESFANQVAVALQIASPSAETGQALKTQIEALSILQQVDQDLTANQDIDHSLQTILEAALNHTTARCGTIGLIDHAENIYENIWQRQPNEGAPLRLKDFSLTEEAWFVEKLQKDQSLQYSDLSAFLGLPDATQWHYPLYADLEDDQALLLILHFESSKGLTSHDKAFLPRLKDHARIALKNALLYEDLHKVIQEKNEFISFISHELKNPLTVIKGYADILRKGMAGEVNEEQIDYLSTINHNVKRMNIIIKDLSDQSYIETKSLRLDFESTPVQEVINEVLHSYAAQIEKKALHISLNIPFEIPNVWCDRMRLIQILSNLVSNAIKYTPENGEININAEHVANEWDEKGAAEVVHFWVADTGYGIKPDDQAHLFEKFFRGTDARIKKLPGTGLGLRIAKSLVEMMGGKMWFTSTLNEGSTFHFTLPI